MNGRAALAIGAIFALMVFAVSGCGSEGSTTGAAASPTPSATFTNEDWGEVVGSPDSYKDSPVELVGKVFQQPETGGGGGIAFQMWADPKNSDWNTIVYASSSVDVATDDYVRVVGTVGDQFKGENVMGAEMIVPTINADSVEIVDAMAAAPAAIKTVTLNDSQSQHRVTLTLETVEYAESETRVFLTFSNGGKDKASFYSFNAKAVQGSKQYSEDSSSSFMNGYPQIESDLLPKTKSSGVIVFPEMDPDKTTRFVFEVASEDYTVTFNPYVFRVK